MSHCLPLVAIVLLTLAAAVADGQRNSTALDPLLQQPALHRALPNTGADSEGCAKNPRLCSMSVKFRARDALNRNTKKPFPRVLLFSCEGSGNTWVRALIEEATGIWTGSMYFVDPGLFALGYRGESVRDYSVVAVKSHIRKAPSIVRGKGVAGFEKVLHIIRNPFSSLVAERKRLVGAAVTFWDTHTISPSVSLFLNGSLCSFCHPSLPDYGRTSVLPWEEWVRTVGLPQWRATLKLALKYGSVAPMLTVSYEQLRENTKDVLHHMLSFIEQDPALGSCALCSKRMSSAQRGHNGMQMVRYGGESTTTAVLEPLPVYPPCMYSPGLIGYIQEQAAAELAMYNFEPPAACMPA